MNPATQPPVKALKAPFPYFGGKRVCGGNWQADSGVCGIFFDPPYSAGDRAKNIYRHDCTAVAQDVATWALGRADNPAYRIVIAGYDGEHDRLDAAGWSKTGWKAQGGYGNQGGKESQGAKNRHRETLWFSPHCLTVKGQESLFQGTQG